MNESKFLKFEKDTVYNENMRRLSKNCSYLNTLAKEGQIVITGDSMVEIWPMTETLAELRHFTGLETYNRGISGDTSNRLLERIEGSVIAAKPKIAIILIGTNDIDLKADDEYVAKNIKQCADSIHLHLPETEIYVIGVLPVGIEINKGIFGGKRNRRAAAVNERLAAYNADGKLHLLDFSALMSGEDGNLKNEYTYDQLHLTIPGYVVLSNALTDAIKVKTSFAATAASDVEALIERLE